jgi:hypothetical protein
MLPDSDSVERDLVLTTKSIIEQRKPVIFAFRRVDKMLVLLPDEKIRPETDLIENYPLAEVIKGDAKLEQLVALKPGERAVRNNLESDWEFKQTKPYIPEPGLFKNHAEWIDNLELDKLFTNNRIPRWIFNPGRIKKYGIINLAAGIALTGISSALFLTQNMVRFSNRLIPGVFGILFLFSGYVLLRSNKKKTYK